MATNAMEQIRPLIQDVVELNADQQIIVRDTPKLRQEVIDRLLRLAVFADPEPKGAARWLIWELGRQVGIYPASIHELYLAKGRGDVMERFTVPAINLRAMAY